MRTEILRLDLTIDDLYAVANRRAPAIRAPGEDVRPLRLIEPIADTLSRGAVGCGGVPIFRAPVECEIDEYTEL
jgi:hypothetical protein